MGTIDFYNALQDRKYLLEAGISRLQSDLKSALEFSDSEEYHRSLIAEITAFKYELTQVELLIEHLTRNDYRYGIINIKSQAIQES